MHRIALTGLLAAAASLTTTPAVAASTYLSKGTAELLTVKLARSLKHPGNTVTRGSCFRVNRTHVNCLLFEREVNDGVAERTNYVVHVSASRRGTVTRYTARTTTPGPYLDNGPVVG